MKFKGFTLAEVLITLMIIGIVAALTIPSVISNYQQQEFKTGLKKAVSVLNEAIQTNIAVDGETPYENGDLFNYLQKHISVIKTGMFEKCYDNNGSIVKDIPDGQPCSGGGSVGNLTFYTTDGMRFEMLAMDNNHRHNFDLKLHETGVNVYKNNRGSDRKVGFRYYTIGDGYSDRLGIYMGFCGSYGLAINSNNTVNPPCVIMVDVNGDKKPNPPETFRAGNQNFEYMYPNPSDRKIQDVFNILITDEKAIPFGVVAQRAMYSK